VNNTIVSFSKNISAGIYVWNCYACDNASQCSFVASNRTFTIDTTNPIATLGTNPINNYNSTSASVTFDIKCSDNIGVSYIEIYSNYSGSWSPIYTNSSYTNDTWVNVTVTSISNGNNSQWAVWCNDSAGLTNITTNRTFSVNVATPPSGGGGSVTPPTTVINSSAYQNFIINGSVVLLYDLNLSYDKTMPKLSLNSVFVDTYDQSGNHTDVNKIEISFDPTTNINIGNIERLDKGKYKIPLNFSEINNQSVNFTVKATQFQKVVTKQGTITLTEPSFNTNFEDNLNKIWNLLKNPLILVIVSILVFIILVLIIATIVRKKKR
jgi:hypothetical protein